MRVKNFIGVRQQVLDQAVRRVAPGAVAMGTTGMADMGEMSMPLPPNTLPMMTGTGPFGPIEMGGMFTVMKVRENLAPGDYRDPGWYKHPPGTVAYEANASRAPAAQKLPAGESPRKNMQMPGMKMPMEPGDSGHHHHQGG
jgi:manganese oxidase